MSEHQGAPSSFRDTRKMRAGHALFVDPVTVVRRDEIAGRTVWFEVAYGNRRATRRMAKENPELSRRGRFLLVTGTIEHRPHSYDAYTVTTATGTVLVIPHSSVSLITTEVSK